MVYKFRVPKKSNNNVGRCLTLSNLRIAEQMKGIFLCKVSITGNF